MKLEEAQEKYKLVINGSSNCEENIDIIDELIQDIIGEQTPEVIDGEVISYERLLQSEVSLEEREYINKLGNLLTLSTLDTPEIQEKRKEIYSALINNAGGRKYDEILCLWVINAYSQELIDFENLAIFQNAMIEEGRYEFIATYFSTYNEICSSKGAPASYPND